MNTQSLHNHLIAPTLAALGKGYNHPPARFLLLGTVAIESDMGLYNRQIKGPALGFFQMEPVTHYDIWKNCDALRSDVGTRIREMLPPSIQANKKLWHLGLELSPQYACAMARMKYAMSPIKLPEITASDSTNKVAFYEYYLEHYHGTDENGEAAGKSTLAKWIAAWDKHGLSRVGLEQGI